MPSTAGITHRGAIVGLGFAKVNNSEWIFGGDQTIIAGVYGKVNNTGTAPTFGGYFWDLKVCGLVLNRKFIHDGSTSEECRIRPTDTFIIGLCNSYESSKAVYLPTDGVEGRTIFCRQMSGGGLYIYPAGGQHIYDGRAENSYI